MYNVFNLLQAKNFNLFTLTHFTRSRRRALGLYVHISSTPLGSCASGWQLLAGRMSWECREVINIQPNYLLLLLWSLEVESCYGRKCFNFWLCVNADRILVQELAQLGCIHLQSCSDIETHLSVPTNGIEEGDEEEYEYGRCFTGHSS